MKKGIKYIIGCSAVALVAFAVLLFSCNGKKDRGSANTAFAQSTEKTEDNKGVVEIPKTSLSVVEALQDVNRSISREVLPSVVEIDVTETRTRSKNPFGDTPFFFFGSPQNDFGPDTYQTQGLGSGVIIRKNGDTYYVLTNNHVAGLATEITVKLNDGRQFDGKLVGKDERMDIALVSFEAKDKNIPLAVLGDSDAVQTGDICYAMGAPLGYRQSVTQGIVSATGRSGDGIGNINDFIQTDAAINQGNSGGPLLNIYGQVIGINTWIATGTGGNVGLGFAIPINNIKYAIDEFIQSGKITYGWIGVSLTNVKPEYKESLGIKNEEGAFASQVFADSPAQKAGIQAGDYITELNGNKVTSVDQLVRDVAILRVGQKGKFKLIRGGKTIEVSVTVEERTEKVSNDNSKLWPGFIAIPLTDEVRKQLKVSDKVKGVTVSNVISKSPAAALKLQNGDIITAVNGTKVSNLAEFYAAMDLTKTDSIQFEIWHESGTVKTNTWKKN